MDKDEEFVKVDDFNTFIERLKILEEVSEENKKSLEAFKTLLEEDNKIFDQLTAYALGCIGKKACSNYAFAIIDTILKEQKKLKQTQKEQANSTQNKKINSIKK